MGKLRVGLVGLGNRGITLLELVLVKIDDIDFTAVCDLYEDRNEAASKIITDSGRKAPFTTTDYKEVITKDRVDCVIIMTPWKYHTEMSVYAMEKGVPCGCEVGGAVSIDECFKLVETWERTKTPFMFLENCCYDRRELMILNMVKQGLLGEIVHCSGGYHHDLRDEVAFGKEKRHYRLQEYLTRNCENYPTHELGPIARILDINNGNRFVSLTSTASKAASLSEYIKEHKADDKELLNAEFMQGDIITTVIKCERGETIVLTLDTTLPIYYNRGFTVRGTKGMYEEMTDSLLLDAEVSVNEHFEWHKRNWGNAEKYAEKYEHEIWKKYLAEGVKAGHGGIDYLIYRDFFDAVKDGTPMPIDVYDAAAWMSITPLSAKSIEMGGARVEVPDFKNITK